jgi:DNA-binding MarR family transcriptional regulator/N-acetylglutamate synthase-like GNAT family acetyltransferase
MLDNAKTSSAKTPSAKSFKDQSFKDRVATVRRFNRFYTRQIGLLRKGFLNSPFSLTEMRILYELAHSDAPSATDIARRLDLDAGYLSRTLRKFEKSGLIKRAASAQDARQTHLTLTAKGRKTFAPYEQRSDDDVAEMLGKLSEADQARLVGAMHNIEELLGEVPDISEPYLLRPPRYGDFGWIAARHGVLYAQEYGWTEPFEGLCAQIVADFANKNDPARERCWIAERDGENVGTVMLVRDSDEVARIRLLLVEPKARGLGIGRRLVDECLHFARHAGYRRITLWTHSILTGARTIYQNAGFTLTTSEAYHRWGNDVVGETWDLTL